MRHGPLLPWYQEAGSSSGQLLSSPAGKVTGGDMDVVPVETNLPAHTSAETLAPHNMPAQSSLEEGGAGRGQNTSKTKPTRRTKAHVASACVNCKRAHLSCDIKRPCTRCVATGKQDSCVDVQHKKRGRPRIREEQDIEGPGRFLEPARAFTSTSGAAADLSSLSDQRTSNGRNLYSLTGEFGSAVPPPNHGLSGIPSTILNLPTTSSSSTLSPPDRFASSEVPVALLDLDLVIMKTNPRFQELVAGGVETRGHSLEHFLGPSAIETTRRLRGELRGERNAREPSYLPPIITPGEQGAVESITEDHLDVATSDYLDRSERLTFRLSGGHLQNIPVRIKLARTSVFFVALAIYVPSGRVQSPNLQQALETQSPTAGASGGLYSIRQNSPFAYTTRASPLQSFQSLSTSLPPVSAAGSNFAVSPPPRHEYPRSHSSTPSTTIPSSAGLFPRPEFEYGIQSMRQDIARQPTPPSTSQRPQLPPITGMLPSSREASEQMSTYRERSQSSGARTQEREGSDQEPKRRRLDITDVLE
ncbi:MAG: hypothetical protein Q9157_000836 [Trypethelium eluteriae]